MRSDTERVAATEADLHVAFGETLNDPLRQPVRRTQTEEVAGAQMVRYIPEANLARALGDLAITNRQSLGNLGDPPFENLLDSGHSHRHQREIRFFRPYRNDGRPA